MSALIRLLFLGVFGGPLLVIAGGYAVAYWHAVAVAIAIMVAILVILVVLEMFRQRAEDRANRPTFDADAEARRAFAVDRDAVMPGSAAAYRRHRAGPRAQPASVEVPHRWRAADFDDLLRPPR